MELSIDTSTRYAAISLSSKGEVSMELTWRSARNHSVELVPAIQGLMARAGVEMHQIDAIFVAKGPGGFSALRVGMSTAKAMAEALDLPLVGVGTLDIEARPYLGLDLPVQAVIEAGRARVYVGTYEPRGQGGPPLVAVVGHDEFASAIEAPTLFCGEGLSVVADIVRERAAGHALMVEIAPPTRKASVLAHIGYQRLFGGQDDDRDMLQPTYVRSTQILYNT